TCTVKISQALQTPVGSIQGGVPLSRVHTNQLTNPDDDDERFIRNHLRRLSTLVGSSYRESTVLESGIQGPPTENPESSTCNPESIVWNPESKT
ncbi:unnamed protein product, partial [Porites evermanni]